MRYQEKKPSVPKKLTYLVVAVICVMIGMIGLIIPIIPGILFLVFAVFLFGKVSSRFKRWSDQHPTIRKIQNKLGQLDTVGYMNRVRVVALMTLDMIVSSAAQIAAVTRQVRRKFS